MSNNISGKYFIKKRFLLFLALFTVIISLAPLTAFGAAVWTPRTSGMSGSSLVGLVVDKNTPTTIYALTAEGGLYKTTNSGTSWLASNQGLPLEKRVAWNNLFGDMLSTDPGDANILYANFNGKIFQYNISTATWTEKNTGIPPCSSEFYTIAGATVDPTDSNHIFAGAIASGCAGGLYESTDRGVSWSHVTTIGPLTNDAWKLAFDPNDHTHLYLATVHLGFLYSTDNGVTWVKNMPAGSSGFGSAVAAISPSGATKVFYGDETGLYRSDNLGLSWTSLASSVPGIVFDIKFSSSSPLIGYVASTSGVFKTTDGGASWSEIGSHQSKSPSTIAIHPTNPSIVYLGSSSTGIYRSEDGGTTFTQIVSGIPISLMARGLVISPADPSVYYVSINGLGFFRSGDKGYTWTNMNTTNLDVDETDNIIASYDDPNVVYAGWGKKYKSTDGGATFTLSLDPGGTRYYQAGAMDPENSNHLIVAENNTTFAVFETFDGGQSWSPSTLAPNNYIEHIIFDPTNSQRVYAATYNYFWKSENGGATWTGITAGFTGQDSQIDNIAVDPANPSILYVAARASHILKSTDYGNSWTLSGYAQDNLDYSPNRVIVDNFGNVYTFTSYGWEISTDGGASWTAGSNTGLTSPFFTFNDAQADPEQEGRLITGDIYQGFLIYEPFAPTLETGTLTVTDDNGGQIEKNDIMTYSFTITNNGTADATCAEANFSLSQNESYVSGSATLDDSPIPDSLRGSTLTLTLGTLVRGESTTVSFSVTTTGGSVTQNGRVTAAEDTTGVSTNSVSFEVVVSSSGGSRRRSVSIPDISTPVPSASPSVPALGAEGLCPHGQLMTQNLHAPARDGKYSRYTKGIVKEAKILQAHLNRLGFVSGKEDGILGPITNNAIKSMQLQLGTKPDGYVGPLTRELINNSCGKK